MKNQLHIMEDDLETGVLGILAQMVYEIEKYLGRIAYMNLHYPPKELESLPTFEEPDPS